MPRRRRRRNRTSSRSGRCGRTRGCAPRRLASCARAPRDEPVLAVRAPRAGRARRTSRRRSSRRPRRARRSSSTALVVAVQHEPVAGRTRRERDVQLAAGRHVEDHALLERQLRHGAAQERLRRVRDPVGKRGDRLATTCPQVLLVVDEQRRAELVRESRRSSSRRSPASRRRRPRRCRAAAVAARAGSRAATSTPAPTHRAGRGRWRGRSRADSTSQRRAWVSSTRDVVTDHVAVVVEAVEPVGQLAHPRRDLVRRALVARDLDDLGQLGQRPQHLELALGA